MEERLTRGEGKVRGGWQTYSARHLIDLAGSACLSSMIFTGRFTQVPAVLQRVTRFESHLDGRTETECERAPILLARVWGVGGRRGRYPRVTVRRPSRIAKMATYSTPYPRGVGGLAINRDRLSSNTATSAAHLRVQLATDVRIKPPTVLNH